MRRLLFSGLLLAASALCLSAQTPGQNPNGNPQPTPAATPQSTDYVRPSGKTRFKRYLDSMFGPTTLAKNVASSGWSTWRNSPEEWGTHWEGFGKRFASSLGKGIVRNSIQFGLDEAFTLDSHFYRSKNRSFKAKVSNALLSTVTARKKNGDRTLGFPRLIGTYSAGIIAAETWYPSRYTWKDGAKSATTSLAFTAAFNLFKEFWKK